MARATDHARPGRGRDFADDVVVMYAGRSSSGGGPRCSPHPAPPVYARRFSRSMPDARSRGPGAAAIPGPPPRCARSRPDAGSGAVPARSRGVRGWGAAPADRSAPRGEPLASRRTTDLRRRRPLGGADGSLVATRSGRSTTASARHFSFGRSDAGPRGRRRRSRRRARASRSASSESPGPASPPSHDCCSAGQADRRASCSSTASTCPAERPRSCGSWRQHVQMVFQDPYSALNPRMRIGEIVAEPLEVHPRFVPRRGHRVAGARAARARRAARRRRDGYPHQFSGGSGSGSGSRGRWR